MRNRRSWLPDGSTIRTLAIAVLVLGLVAGAGCAGISDSGGNGTDPTTNDTDVALPGVSLIDHVPAEQNLLVHVNTSVTQDATTQAFLEAGSEQAEEEEEVSEEAEDVDQEEFQESLDEFESSTGLDPREFEEAIYFGEYDEVPGSVDDANADEQFGLIANTDWTTAELTGAVESNDTIHIEALEYEESGVFYELTNDAESAEDPLYLGVLGDGAYVLGVESSVEDTLDVAYADGDALSGTLRDAYNSTRDGYATVTMTVPENTGEDQTGMGADVAQNMEVLTGTYYTEDGELGLEAQVTMSNENYATQLSAAASILTAQAGQSEEAPDALQHLSVEQNGAHVVFNYASDVETLIDAADSQ
ncbi:hypothetical protein [Salinarchaeum laminariae]|uniref:hypothetical protein n=1 Tax=Salinarchaeum laminariae TaxID=869888 RepID=UPI0020BE6A84|nr:hypothetical protein [Salinarchaeum laminariae]